MENTIVYLEATCWVFSVHCLVWMLACVKLNLQYDVQIGSWIIYSKCTSWTTFFVVNSGRFMFFHTASPTVVSKNRKNVVKKWRCGRFLSRPACRYICWQSCLIIALLGFIWEKGHQKYADTSIINSWLTRVNSLPKCPANSAAAREPGSWKPCSTKTWREHTPCRDTTPSFNRMTNTSQMVLITRIKRGQSLFWHAKAAEQVSQISEHSLCGTQKQLLTRLDRRAGEYWETMDKETSPAGWKQL